MSDLLLQAVTEPKAAVSAEWWKWAYSFPDTQGNNPFSGIGDPGAGQIFSPFFFLAGSTSSDPVTRTVEIPVNQGFNYVFAPLINTEWDVDQFNQFYGIPVKLIKNEQVQQFAAAFADTAQDLFIRLGAGKAEIIPEPPDYQQARGPFTYQAAAGNVFGVNAGFHKKAFADGFYVALDLSALPPEPTAINFGGAFAFDNLVVPKKNHPLFPAYQDVKANYGTFSQNITYNISFDLNEIAGTNSQDVLTGTNGWDNISGLNGKDYIVGLEGNDVLRGGNGADTLIGTNPSASCPGYSEIDILYGGNGPDTFVLGDVENVYYTGNGLKDYALIKDLRTEDTIQLKGNPESYELSELYSLGGKSGTSIFFTGTGTSELIGFVEGVTGLSLASNLFEFN
ncbi:hypothetical protein IQ264_22015 [Phormidium sp. LEGE 05292]|uniref:calcium-binding protein n=1 Tax=[Phormidium] sp. LEGE 05292 TaxID=767427 RepID=UPI0018811A7A|nr:hypothetical protein [Phormidium sp. LEGE 05292]MBE9228101.1 hypothetical protein [Phormidium sp. LEGE 05292]